VNNKQLVTIASASLIVVGSILAVIWTTPAELFVSIGLVVSGIILFLLYITISVAGWADNLVGGTKTEISFSLDPEQDVKSDEKNKGEI
jgi:energy-converting hydrogenase Eha subunit C|tara:strand:- start:143 stop:409 length:267 start_codon:yes stop_codon:yes gene_type:complete